MNINVKYIVFAQFAIAAIAPTAHAMQISGNAGCVTAAGLSQATVVTGPCSSQESIAAAPENTWWAFEDGQIEFGSTLKYCLWDNGATSPGSPVVLENCADLPTTGSWKLLRTVLEPQGTVANALVDTSSNLCLDSTGVLGAQLQINTCNASPNQNWYLNEMSIEIGGGGACMTLPSNNVASGTAVVTAPCDGRIGSLWQSGDAGQITGLGTEMHGTKAVTKCLTALGSKPGDGVVIQACAKKTSKRQTWTIEQGFGPAGSQRLLLVDGDGLCLARGTLDSPGSTVQPCKSSMSTELWGVQ